MRWRYGPFVALTGPLDLLVRREKRGGPLLTPFSFEFQANIQRENWEAELLAPR